MITEAAQFYVQRNKPLAGWRNGSWSLYRISSDEIARRVGFDEKGNVNRRDGLPGYVGTYSDLAALAAAMER